MPRVNLYQQWRYGVAVLSLVLLLLLTLSLQPVIAPSNSPVFGLTIVLVICLLVIGTYCVWLRQLQQQTEADYHNLLKTAYEGIWIIDADGRTTYVNQRLAEMFGYTVEQMLARPVFDFMDDKVRVDAQQRFDRTQPGIKKQYISFRRQDGSVLSCFVSTTPRLDRRGTFIGTLIVLTGVDDLEQQVQTMDTILSASPDHFYMFDRDGRFIYASRPGLQALGLQKSDIIGKTEVELGFPPEVIEQHKQRREAVFATGETLRGETSVPTVDGVRQHEYMLIPIPDTSGRVQVVVAISREVTQQRPAQEELRQYRHHLEALVAARTTELSRTIEQLNQEIVERQRAEAALKESEAYYESLVDVLPLNLFCKDLEGRITFANQAFLATVGMSLAECLGKTVYDLYPKELADKYNADDNQVIQTGEVLDIIERHKAPSYNKIIYVQVVKAPLRDASGAIIGTQGIFWDITPRKQAEQRLQKSEAHLAEAQNIAHIGSWEFDVSTQTLTWSDEVFRIFGLDPEKRAPTYLEHIQQFHPDDREILQNYMYRAIAEGKSYKLDCRILRPDRSIRYVNARAKVDFNSEGQVIRVFGTMLDITERKQAEQELRRQIQYRQLLAEIAFRILESLQIEVILQTAVTELQQLLQADRVLFYRLLPNCNGKVVAEALVGGCQSLVGRELVNHCFEGEYLQQYQQEIHAWPDVEQAGFQPCHLEMLRQFTIKANLIVPIFLKDKIWGMLFVHQCSAPRQWKQFEVDLLRQLADQLSIALAQAELLEQATSRSQELARSNAELEQFAYVASHDLQEPLRTLASYAKLLSRRYSGQLDEKGNRFIQYIMEEALRMQALINDLLRYSRVGRQAKNFTATDARAVFDIVVRRLEEAISNSGATVTCGELPTVMADETQLVQLFQNLISNALKYRTQEPPVVHVGAQRLEAQWLFWVRDNGIGIDPKYAERIFVIFQRLHTQDEYSGTGIGLAIAAKIVERHGGRIWVESEPGQGATFYFTIPVDILPTLSIRGV